jgi:stage II sporulation protein AA (anti-sigma F factor antagonist)
MAELNIEKKLESSPDCMLIKLKGNLDLFTFGELKKVFEELGPDPKAKKLVVDLSGVPYVASSGWGVLMARAKALKDEAGRLVVIGLNEGNGKVYETLHVNSIMPMALDLGKAKDILKKK